MGTQAVRSAPQPKELIEQSTEEQFIYLDNYDEGGESRIIGRSRAFQRVMQQIEAVAPTDATVLVQGETGAGKELIARAIHEASARRERAFVKINCAAIPSGLLESELFGHEKGAFTGAVGQRIGRFETANLGTLFLDEIGDIPLELQPKLLRVLQEQEFERLGGNRTLHTDVRLVAATNQNLAEMIDQRQFRMDLYYRLNIFPIEVPPLRQRPEDIPALVRHFVGYYARRMHKNITRIPTRTMQALLRYAWPGNVRELQNFIERSVILSSGEVLHAPLHEFAEAPAESDGLDLSLDEVQRQHILRVLRATGGVVGGPHGAAARLKLPRTTLINKMRKLGITKLPE